MKLSLVLGFGWILAVGAVAQNYYPNSPDWVSSDTQVSTGAALVDLDRDGWFDLVVSNGNDMQQQHVAVYYNQGDGTFPLTPDWQSDDVAYNGHLDVADVNGDGWPDIAVAVLGRFSTIDNCAKLYLNNGGTLSSLPDWESDEIANAFGCAFGDVNNDGRPDLALATGWAYDPQNHYHNYVYLNIDGALATTASWQSDDMNHYQGVLWADTDHDGWLDLVGVPNSAETQIYHNLGGTLETTASWQTSGASGQDAIMAVVGDVTGDGYPDLFVTDNTQLNGSGRFRQYTGLAAGDFEATYSWSYFDGNGSAVALADVDGDGDLDLATGAWWDKTRLFLNTGTGFEATPDWNSGPSSVIEKIVFADLDNDGIEQVIEPFAADGSRLFHLGHQPIQKIVAVRRDGVELGADEYAFSREFGWVVIGTAPAASMEIEYTYSTMLDMAVTNWDNNKGNYVYYRREICAGDVNSDGSTDLVDLSVLLADYGCTGSCVGDLDDDGEVGLNDLAILLGDYGCGG